MAGNPIKIGPFTGGLNTFSDAASVGDNELVDCVNFELDLDGSLIGRPPVTSVAGAVGFTSRILLLGYAVFQTGKFLIGSTNTGTYYRANPSAPWILICANLKSTSMVQYGDSVYILATPDSAVPGGAWTISSGYTSLPGMPKGQSILVFKDRGFICPGENATLNNSRLYFSKATDLTQWTDFTVAGTIDVNPGDGQALVDIIVYKDAVLCLKQHSTYVFSYATTPSIAAGATLRPVNTTIGVQTKKCVVSYVGNLFLYHEGNIYEVTNYNFKRINTKVPFSYDGTSPGTFVDPIFISVVGDRLLVRYYNRVYAFGLRTQTWTRWESVNYFGPFVAEPTDVVSAVNPRFFAGSCVDSVTSVYQLNDGYDNIQSEAMNCSLTTKHEDMSHYIRVGRYFVTQEQRFKRLFWWGISVNTDGVVTGTVVPVVFNSTPTWRQVAQYKWSDLVVNTWRNPTTTIATITTTVGVAGNIRRFIKFPNSLRFRLVYFKIDMSATGTLSNGPVRFHNIAALVVPKESVVAQIT